MLLTLTLDGVDELLMRLDFRDEEPQVVDLSPEGGVVETLKESKLECLMTDKVRPSFSPAPSSPYSFTHE